ncbi:hypothetical protein C482_19169 [Natrialba chahannaoensis JCM 10990]|uniref:Glyoxalase/fosfomycin resistance/dioxygenase domain-containing protein n=2 Tax=Natrialba chahannaoensis TaxID=68911 RepID=M0A4A2_9EURY|nr:hypothetical protein C482_19169 [Natrialba chahannaoensis JCM 10990]
MVDSVKETVAFYEAHFGFEVTMAVPASEDNIRTNLETDEEIVYTLLERDGVEIMFQEAESLRSDVPAFSDSAVGGSVCLYIEVEDIEAFYESLADDVEVVTELNTTWYGMTECYVRDINGYILGFAEETQ